MFIFLLVLLRLLSSSSPVLEHPRSVEKILRNLFKRILHPIDDEKRRIGYDIFLCIRLNR